MKVAAIIPARGGSKGIPRKNLIDFCGKPLIAWSIEHCLKTKGIGGVWVSSDSDEILEIAVSFGAQAIKRPAELSTDTASSEVALLHAADVLKDYNTFAFLQATSPLRKPDDLGNAIAHFEKEKLDSLFAGALLEDFLIWEKSPSGELKSFNYDYQNRGRRQDRKPQYVENGSFYIFNREVLQTHKNRLGGKIGVYLMDFWQSFEIDELKDVGFISQLFKEKI